MEQRPLRLGDILDDYCPRERRVTNHAIVAMVEQDVKQTRCTTCDAEHAYKGGREPRRRKKDTTAVLYREVLAGMPDVEGAPAAAAPVAMPLPDEPITVDDAPVLHSASEEEPAPEAEADVPEEPEHQDEPRTDAGEEGPFHRRLIRATLPRPEGQKDARPIPEFTIRGNGNGNFRGHRAKMRGHGGNGHGGNAQRGRRFGGGHQGGGRPGFGPSAGQGRPNRGPRKRSR